MILNFTIVIIVLLQARRELNTWTLDHLSNLVLSIDDFGTLSNLVLSIDDFYNYYATKLHERFFPLSPNPTDSWLKVKRIYILEQV